MAKDIIFICYAAGASCCPVVSTGGGGCGRVVESGGCGSTGAVVVVSGGGSADVSSVDTSVSVSVSVGGTYSVVVGSGVVVSSTCGGSAVVS